MPSKAGDMPMKKYIPIFILILLGVGSFNHPGMAQEKKSLKNTMQFTHASPEKAGFSAVRLQRLDTLLQSYINQGVLPNAVALIARHGKIVYLKSFGWKNMERKIPLKNDDIFRIASQTKAIVSVGLMMLFEKGLFLLDDPISDYVPEFKNPKVWTGKESADTTGLVRPAKNEITFRHLLSHTSGIGYESPLFDKLKIPYFCSTDSVTLKQIILKIAASPLKHDPGADWTYGLSIDVAGYLIEIISGKPLDKFLNENIFQPIGMKDTCFYLPESKAGRLVELYQKTDRQSTLQLADNNLFRTFPIAGAKTYFSGGAGLVGAIEDYARFCQMILNKGECNGRRILSRKTVELMVRNQIGEANVRGSGDKFGLGFQIYTRGQNTLRGANGSEGTLKWGGMYCTDYNIDPSEDLIFLF
jgi:CubicO group peptidase (beta-lactamase class C family)